MHETHKTHHATHHATHETHHTTHHAAHTKGAGRGGAVGGLFDDEGGEGGEGGGGGEGGEGGGGSLLPSEISLLSPAADPASLSLTMALIQQVAKARNGGVGAVEGRVRRNPSYYLFMHLHNHIYTYVHPLYTLYTQYIHPNTPLNTPYTP